MLNKVAEVSRMNPLFDTRPVVVQTTSQSLCQSNGQGFLFPDYIPTESSETNGLSKAASGSIGETLFDLWCMARGIPVYTAIANQTKEDRIIKMDGRFLAVQIKSGRMGNNGRTTVFSLWAGIPYKAAIGKGPKRPPKDEDADLLFCIGVDYTNPGIHNSFAHVRKWSSNLPQSLSLPNGVGWPEPSDIAALLSGVCNN